jgi:hypothetical protein
MKKNKRNSYKIPPSVVLTVLMWHEDCGQTPRANVGEKSPELQYEVLKYKLSSKAAARQEQATNRNKTVNGVVRGSPNLLRQRATTVIMDWLEGDSWRNNRKWRI